MRDRLDKNEFVNDLKKEKIREQLYQRISPYVLPILNTEIGKSLVKEDLEKLIESFEKFLSGTWEDVKVESFVEMKYLFNKIVTTSKRISKYLELDK
jgi:hypothetical protein